MAKKIDRETYYCVKRMLKLGKRTDEITKSAKVGAGTVSYIRRASSYEEYQQTIQRLKEKRQRERAEPKQPQQLPFIEPTPPKTKDLRQIILTKIDDLNGEIDIYKSIRQPGCKEARAAIMAKMKLEEAQMWLERYI